ncbi:MAG: phosphatase PAP2 family protein [Saprospiraceae bacterium]|nr:phosphatase PAP2 family protein [Saprospiraceae bacterium]
MLEILQNWDAALFRFINYNLGNPLFDALLPWCREKWFWMPAYVFLAAFSLLNFGKKGGFIILGLVVAAGLADFTSSTLIKKNVQRLRPCNEPEMMQTVVRRAPCGSGYSFTSSHAANHFAAAVFIVAVFGSAGPWVRLAALSWAALIAFSQVYVGVHYPGDVIGGALLGTIIGWWTVLSGRRLSLLPQM